MSTDPLLPYGVFSTPGSEPRVGALLGDRILDLSRVLPRTVFAQPSLNAFMATGRESWLRTRRQILDVVATTDVRDASVALETATLHLPFEVADFVDFYSSLEHATNVGRLFRPDEEPLKPNWRELPVGYHGRAGTVVVSGTDVVRPHGQLATGGRPAYAPSQRLDLEVELGVVVGTPSALGTPVPVDGFADHAFGLVVLIDWSARDVQAWEYQPLGPFLAKSFATTISPWVVPFAALEFTRTDGPAQHPPPLPYLAQAEPRTYDLAFELVVNGTTLSRPRFRGMYWSPAQQLAHLTANGASLRTGDLYGSGTISGAARDEQGCLLEITSDGAEPVELDDGSALGFLRDGDVVEVRASAPDADGTPIPLGEAVGRVLPAR